MLGQGIFSLCQWTRKLPTHAQRYGRYPQDTPSYSAGLTVKPTLGKGEVESSIPSSIRRAPRQKSGTRFA